MTSPSIIYTMIAKNKETILADYTEHSGNFRNISIEILKRVNKNHNATVLYQQYKFHYIDLKGLTIMSMSDKIYDDNVIICFLESTLDIFHQKYSSNMINSAKANGLPEFENVIKSQMSYYNNNPKVDDSISKLKKAVLDFKNNVLTADQLLSERGEKLEEINIKADRLKVESDNYFEFSKKVKKSAWWTKWYFILFAVFVLLLIIYIITAASGCGFDLKCIFG